MEIFYTPLLYLLNLVLKDDRPGLLKLCHVVNFQKGFTGLFVRSLMGYYSNYSLGCWVYLSLHGSYGVIWVLKDLTFPDKNAQKALSLLSFTLLVPLLSAYWVPAFLLAKGYGIQFPSGERIAVCVLLCVIGNVVMMVSDAQKYYVL